MINEGGVQQGGYDIARVRVEPGGEVTVYTGLCEMGQGVTSALAQVCADNVGVHPDHVNVVHGDSSQVPYTGYGTGASRGASVGGAAVMKAGGRSAEGAPDRGHMLEVAGGPRCTGRAHLRSRYAVGRRDHGRRGPGGLHPGN